MYINFFHSFYKRLFMSKISLIVAISNAGKSTYAKQYCNEFPNTIELNRDIVRFNYISPEANGWKEYNFTHLNETLVSDFIYQQALKAVRENKDIIVSDTNLSPITRQHWLAFADIHGIDEFEYIIFNSHFENIFYNSHSDVLHSLPYHVITSQYKKFCNFLEEPFNPIIKYTVL